jgi:CubicO group peptidase (beta-lactamase class C family)
MNEELKSVIAKAGGPPGLSLVVVTNDKVVFSEGYGLADRPRNIPATPDTVYHWWSMTKVPTAIAVLQL